MFWHGLAMLNVMLATGLTRLWWGEVRLTPLLFFTIATAASTLTGGLSPGLLAAVLSWFCFDYFCLPPIFAMDPGSVVLIRLVGLGLVAVGVHIPRAARSRAERQLRRAMAELEERVEARTDQLSVANTKLKEEAAEREKAEDALRRSEQYFRSLIENASDVITVLNRDGRIRYESTSVRRRLGYTREELKGLSRLELAHPDDAPHMQQALEHLIRERGTSVSIEYRVRHRDGSWRIFESIAENRLDDPGMAGIVIASRDITERRRAEKALRESEDRYRAFIAQSSEGIWRCESAQLMPPDCSEEEQLKFFFETAYIAECNDAMARMSGLNCAEEMIGRSVSELLPPTDEKNRELLRSFIRSGYRIVDAETQEQDRDGNPKWFSNTMIGILENGRLARAWGTQLDITRRKLSETALRESETQLRATSKFIQEIIYNAGEGIAVMDHDRRYILWNRVIEEKTGLRAEEILGRRTDEAFPYLKDLGLDQLHDRVLRGETVTAPDLETFRTDGRSFWWSVKCAPHRNAEGEIIGIICLSHDMTERKQAEKQQAELLAREQAARQQAETASRLKDEFLATVSHELRTPLSAIIGWARMLRDGSVSLERVHYALETIERNARVQTQLINDLLDVSRIISGKLLIEPESVDLAAVISAAISTVCPAAEARSIQLEFNPTEQGRACEIEFQNASVVWPESVRPLASVIVPDIMTGTCRPWRPR